MHTQTVTTLLNGEPITLDAALPLTALLQAQGIDPSQVGIAVAVNRKLVSRGQWDKTHVQPGDAVEVVHARQGG